jgi:hypothetical protein
MDLTSDKSRPYYGRRSGPFIAVFQTLKGVVRRVIGLFLLTDEDKLKAGIIIRPRKM